MRECEKATQKGKVHRNAWELFKSFDPDVFLLHHLQQQHLPPWVTATQRAAYGGACFLKFLFLFIFY